MHDTFLNQNLYEAIVELCGENSIAKIFDLTITVHTDSHISEDSIREYFSERENMLVGDWTNIQVLRREIEPLTAVIDEIEGEIFQ